MSHARAARSTLQRTRRGRARIATGRPHPRSVRRVLLAMLGAPLAIRIIVAAAVAVALWLAMNWVYQAIRKPTELFFPVSGALTKTPARDLAAVRAALPRAFDVRYHARAPGRARPGRGRGQPGGADVLALAPDVESFRAVPAGVERGRHVPDHRRDVRARRSATASTTMWRSRMDPGTMRHRAGSTASTHASCRATLLS